MKNYKVFIWDNDNPGHRIYLVAANNRDEVISKFFDSSFKTFHNFANIIDAGSLMFRDNPPSRLVGSRESLKASK